MSNLAINSSELTLVPKDAPEYNVESPRPNHHRDNQLEPIKPKWGKSRKIVNRYPNGICDILTADYISIQPRSKIEFDRIGSVEQASQWRYDPITTKDKNDGSQWESRLLTKKLFCGKIQVIFRWFEVRLAQEDN